MNQPAAIEVLGRQQLGRSTTVHVLRAYGRTLVVGVGVDSMTLLASGDEPLTDPQASVPETATELELAGLPRSATGWRPVVDALRDRTVRRT